MEKDGEGRRKKEKEGEGRRKKVLDKITIFLYLYYEI